MSKWTAEEVREKAHGYSLRGDDRTAAMLNAYADTLSKPADSGRVTDERLRAVAVIYGSGYRQGHEDTVESVYTDVVHYDRATYWLDTVREMVDEDADLAAALAAQGQGDQGDGMQAALPKPRMPIGVLGLEDFCFCNNEVSLQAVAGGGSLEGYLGSVHLKIGGKFVTYIREPASPAGVPDGEDDAAIDRAAHVLQEVIAENDGEPSEMAHDQVRRILAAYAAPSAPEGDGGAE